MTPETLEGEIEREWADLAGAYHCRTLYLTSTGRIAHGHHAEQRKELHEIGTYTRSVHLEDFRADVFHVYETMKGRGQHGS